MKITTIRATSRASVKIRDSFYTVEYCEERLMEDGDDVEEERAKLWDTCNAQVDHQIEDIINSFSKR